MKRKYREIQEALDADMHDAIKSGTTSHPELKQHMRSKLAERLTADLPDGQAITIPYLLDYMADGVTIHTKQRLRNAGHIEITNDRQPILVEDIERDDAESIFLRRQRQNFGRTKSNFDFAEKHGLTDQVEECRQQLLTFGPDECVDVDVEELEAVGDDA